MERLKSMSKSSESSVLFVRVRFIYCIYAKERCFIAQKNVSELTWKIWNSKVKGMSCLLIEPFLFSFEDFFPHWLIEVGVTD